jgi:hypothetical protein
MSITEIQTPPVEFCLGRDGVTVPADAGVQQLRDIIERLSNDLADSKRGSENIALRRDAWREDFETVTGLLLEEADRRDWCDEYEAFCNEIDERLRVGEMPRRLKEIEVEVTITATTYYTLMVPVMARDDDHAAELLRDDPDTYFDPESALSEAMDRGYATLDSVEWEVA